LLNPGHLFIGSGTLIRGYSQIYAFLEVNGQKFESKILIGDDVYIGRQAFITCIDQIEIRNGCVISDQVYISDAAHGLHPNSGPIMKQPLESRGPILIEEACFLGVRVSVLPGVTLGKHCVVGAHSVVTRSFPGFSMVAGVPARLIKSFDPETDTWRSAGQVR
jgi:acetyltransferase-like isoleucine patch superfamily enzyme